MRRFVGTGRQWIHCLVVLRLIDASADKFIAAHLPDIQHKEQNECDDHNKHDDRFAIGHFVRYTTIVCLIANLQCFVGTIGTIVPAVAEQQRRYAGAAGTLEVGWLLAAIGLVVAVGAMGGAVANQIFVNTLARLASKLIDAARWASHFVRLVWTIDLAVTAPGHWYTVFVQIQISHDANAGQAPIHGRRTGEMIRSACRQCTTIPFVFQQHETLRAGANFHVTAILIADAEVRAFAAFQSACMVLICRGLWRPNGHNIRDLGQTLYFRMPAIAG